MTTEEIDKAVEEYAESLKSITLENLVGRVMPYALRGAFKEGLESANKHWQEKTRWIPVEERLPKVRKTPFFIAVKEHDDSDKFRANIETFLIRDESDVLWVWQSCKYWKEIE